MGVFLYFFMLSPLDDRYASKVLGLLPIFSEFGLMKARLVVEIEWLIFLSDKKIAPLMSTSEQKKLRSVAEKFDDKTLEKIKKIEKETNHDVKAVEIFLRNQVAKPYWPFLHFACTSEDINNSAYNILLSAGIEVVTSNILGILEDLEKKSLAWKAVPMLSRTHGQPATPTTVGKEFAVFFFRFNRIFFDFLEIPLLCKFSGATGNFAAHSVAFPKQNWIALSREFAEERLFFVWNPLTTQIESHDSQVQLLNALSHLSSIGVDLCRDMWGYISAGYFGQKVVKGEVGSSTMPHKVNPIDFENAEGNFKLTRGIARTLADELPISRFQRDLTDSTLQRNFGLVFGHFLLALKSLQKGLSKIEIKKDALEKDLNDTPEVLTEAVQTILRAHGDSDAYDTLKKFSRGHALTLKQIQEFIKKSKLPEAEKKRMLKLTPASYVGLSEKLVEEVMGGKEGKRRK